MLIKPKSRIHFDEPHPYLLELSKTFKTKLNVLEPWANRAGNVFYLAEKHHSAVTFSEENPAWMAKAGYRKSRLRHTAGDPMTTAHFGKYDLIFAEDVAGVIDPSDLTLFSINCCYHWLKPQGSMALTYKGRSRDLDLLLPRVSLPEFKVEISRVGIVTGYGICATKLN